MTPQTTAAALVEVKSILDRQIAEFSKKDLHPTAQTTGSIEAAATHDLHGTVKKILQTAVVIVDAIISIWRIWTS
jgi:hypothetical protein